MTNNLNESSTPTMRTPCLPTLYFSEDDSTATTTTTTSQQQRHQQESSPSLQSLPPELIHRCLAQYSDWGDLAKLACVQSKWKNVVNDAAEFGGREAMWELSVCLLGEERESGVVVDANDEEESSDDVDVVTPDNDNTNTGVVVAKTNNRGLDKNEALAIKYLTRLSGVQVEEAQLESEIISTDTEKSALPSNWQFNKMNDNANEAALLKLAHCHLVGVGTAPNATLALHYLQAAYHLTKSVESAHTLALIYEYPQHSNNLIPIDVFAAFAWFKAAAEGGHVHSMSELALCYELGCGTVQNDNEALDWYTKAANLGHGASHYSVGEHYEEARGVPHDEEEACIWYHRAAVLGEEDGVSGLKRLRNVARRVLSHDNLQELALEEEERILGV
eukprot:scaffold13584_cov184-Alexandrium_tamarense.AAC.2